jgi:zinc/manganese transport system substrate-binding protein
MPNRRVLLALGLGLLAAPAWADGKLPVVASFSILGDMTQRVGGERIAVTTLVGPDGDAHVYEPGPADAKAVAAARVLVVNGLGFEGWMDRLEQAAGFKGVEAVASAGIAPLSMAEADEAGHDDHDHDHDHGHDGVDPHAWQNVANAQAYVRNIAAALERADPEGAAVYRANAQAYLAELEALDAEIRAAMTAIPAPQRVLATSHDAFGYFAAAYGVTVLAPQGMSTESEASAADVAGLIRQIKADGVRAVFVENITNPRLLEQVSRETGAAIGGVLFSDALSPPGGPAATYVDMMRHNGGTIASALQS